MVQINAKILQFANQGEKTGWTYIEISAAVIEKIKPGNRKSFRVKGKIDDYLFSGLALLPMGKGGFIMTINATIRKNIKKKKGDLVKLIMEADDKPLPMDIELMECLADEPAASAYFNSLTLSHRNYFNNYIKSAKTEATKANRIMQSIKAFIKKNNYGQMIRSLTNDRKEIRKR